MGREIRKVVAGWEHPRMVCPHSPWQGGCSEAKRNGGKCFRPLHDRSFSEAADEWKREFAAWERGEHPDYCDDANETLEFWEWGGNPPDRDYYRPEWAEADRSWVQVYETVSEGTPVTPAFATDDELIDYLVAHGDFWDQTRGQGGWDREAATRFVKDSGWAPSMVMEVSAAGARILEPRDGI